VSARDRRQPKTSVSRSSSAVKTLRYRRSLHIVLYWRGSELVFENFARGSRISAAPVVCEILDACSNWRSPGELASTLAAYNIRSVRSTLRQLWRLGFLESSRHGRDNREVAMESWLPWNPAAGFFHFSTKDQAFAMDHFGAFQELKRRARFDPMPRPVKNYPGAPRTPLRRAAGKNSEFAEVLRTRRTWRKFSATPVPLQDVGEILDLTFGIQAWAEVPGLGKAAVKTSPSGGGLHPVEAYVVARKVRGLRSGIYHYDAKGHRLEWLRGGISRDNIKKHLGNQWWFADAAFFVLMTAVFPRTWWKYHYPRVYRAILLEAGHLCQSFCLTATWRGLAPFCTIALADSQWEKLLGIDGVKESIVYAAGAGARPENERGAHLMKLG
jgi:SagB-type dehydrogenase family enzyme